jgi:hypothetical protein
MGTGDGRGGKVPEVPDEDGVADQRISAGVTAVTLPVSRVAGTTPELVPAAPTAVPTF